MNLYIGKFYIHPEDGLIHITSGTFLSNGRVSNHWYWTVVLTGEQHYGYGGSWPEFEGKVEIITQYVVTPPSKV